MPLIPMDPAAASRLRAALLTYREAGATNGVLPEGYHHVRRRALIGKGAQAFVDAVQVLMGWQVHDRAGLRVSPSAPVAAADVVVMMGIGIGPARLAAPCRVVYVVEEPDRRGFAYGTLAGHPERGEEAFIVRMAEDGTVTFEVTAFSRPATWLARATRATRPRRPAPDNDPLPESAGRAVKG